MLKITFWFFRLPGKNCCQNTGKIGPNFIWLVLGAQKELVDHILTPEKYQMDFSSNMFFFHVPLNKPDHHFTTSIGAISMGSGQCS